MLSSWQIQEAARLVRENRDALGEALVRRTPNGAGGYVESHIRAHIAPISAALISMGLYQLGDLAFVSSSEVAQYDEIVRGSTLYYVLDVPFVPRLVDQVLGYQTVLRVGSRPIPW